MLNGTVGRVTAFDALAIIDELNLNGAHPLATPRPAAAPFLDVINSRNVTSFDALVINRLNKQPVSPKYQLTVNVSKKLPLDMDIETRGVANCSELLVYCSASPETGESRCVG